MSSFLNYTNYATWTLSTKVSVVVTLICISLDLWRIWSDEVYVDEVYDHTKLSKVVYMLSMHAYIEYVVILIIYTTVVAF